MEKHVIDDDEFQEGKLRYSLWQMMIVTAIVGALLTLLRCTGLLTVPMLLCSIMWLVLHAIGQKPAIWMGRKLGRNTDNV